MNNMPLRSSKTHRKPSVFDRPWLARLALSAVILGAMGLASYWVFLVPILEAPDEQLHIDYALNIYSAGRLISAREPYHAWNTPIPPMQLNVEMVVHVYTRYLIEASDLKRILFHPSEKIAAAYAAKGYYSDLDRNAPDEKSGDMDGEPRVIVSFTTVYPYGYYSLVGAWMGVLGHFSHRLTVLFFGARMLSVILLGVSLLLVHATARELRFGRGRSILLTAIIGFFPLTSFVASYVQPDNLAFTMVMLCAYLALLVKRRHNKNTLLFLGLSLGLLCVTKYHYYICVLIPILGMLLACRLGGSLKGIRWKTLITITFLPTFLLMFVQIWINYGSRMGPLNPPPGPFGPLREASTGIVTLTHFVWRGLVEGFDNFYMSGTTFTSFWGRFGWMDTPLVIVSAQVDDSIRSGIRIFTVVTLALMLIRLGQVVARLVVVARRGHWRSALHVAFANPLLNALLLFTPFMLAVAALLGHAAADQGRNWLPFILPIFLVTMQYAPKALPRPANTVLSNILTVGLTLYCVFGSYYSIQSIIARFYER